MDPCLLHRSNLIFSPKISPCPQRILGDSCSLSENSGLFLDGIEFRQITSVLALANLIGKMLGGGYLVYFSNGDVPLFSPLTSSVCLRAKILVPGFKVSSLWWACARTNESQIHPPQGKNKSSISNFRDDLGCLDRCNF